MTRTRNRDPIRLLTGSVKTRKARCGKILQLSGEVHTFCSSALSAPIPCFRLGGPGPRKPYALQTRSVASGREGGSLREGGREGGRAELQVQDNLLPAYDGKIYYIPQVKYLRCLSVCFGAACQDLSRIISSSVRELHVGIPRFAVYTKLELHHCCSMHCSQLS